MTAAVVLSGCAKGEGIIARAPSDAEIRAVERLLPKAQAALPCLQGVQWNRSYSYPQRDVSFAGFKLHVYDYSRVNVGLGGAALELPKPRRDGRPSVQAGTISAIKRHYDAPGMIHFSPKRVASAIYDPAAGRLAFDYCGSGSYDPNAAIDFVLYGPPSWSAPDPAGPR